MPRQHLDSVHAHQPQFARAKAPLGRGQGRPATLALQADFAAPTGPQGAAIGDALRLLAVWAVRVAKRGDSCGLGALEVSEGTQADLDFPATGSDVCATTLDSEEG